MERQAHILREHERGNLQREEAIQLLTLAGEITREQAGVMLSESETVLRAIESRVDTLITRAQDALDRAKGAEHENTIAHQRVKESLKYAIRVSERLHGLNTWESLAEADLDLARHTATLYHIQYAGEGELTHGSRLERATIGITNLEEGPAEEVRSSALRVQYEIGAGEDTRAFAKLREIATAVDKAADTVILWKRQRELNGKTTPTLPARADLSEELKELLLQYPQPGQAYTGDYTPLEKHILETELHKRATSGARLEKRTLGTLPAGLEVEKLLAETDTVFCYLLAGAEKGELAAAYKIFQKALEAHKGGGETASQEIRKAVEVLQECEQTPEVSGVVVLLERTLDALSRKNAKNMGKG